MEVLVTGGLGFIGATFCNYWHNNHPQDNITILDNFSEGSSLNNIYDIYPDYVTLITGDIRNEVLVDTIVQSSDIVVHFAAQTHVDYSIGDPMGFVTTNIIGTANILEAVRKYDKRLHHISTDEVFGHLPDGGSFTEDTPYNPRNPYSATKAGADHLVRAYINTYNIRATISNCSNNYGPRQSISKLIPKAITLALEGKPTPLYAGGYQVRDWVYVEDHVRAIEQIILHGVIGETYLVSGNYEITNREVVEKIYKAIGVEPMFDTVTDRPGHDLRYSIDSTKLETTLGWKPIVPFDVGLEQTIRWYRGLHDLEEKTR